MRQNYPGTRSSCADSPSQSGSSRRHAAEFEDAWADWGIEIDDIRAAGDRVVARIRYRGVGKQSGAPITGGLETPATGAVFELREGRILRAVQFVRYEEALEAVGPSE